MEILKEGRIQAYFGGGSTFQSHPNHGLGPKNVNIFSPCANFVLDAGGEFIPWTEDTPKWMKEAYRHMTVGPDLALMPELLNGQKIDFIWASHSHADHVMAIPKLMRYFKRNGKIYGSPHTMEIMRKVFMDTLNFSPYLYKDDDGIFGVIDCLAKREALELGAKELLPGLIWHTRIGGHIPGATYAIAEFKNLGINLLDTGDTASFSMPLVPGSSLIDDIRLGRVPCPNIIVGTDFTNPSREEFRWEPVGEELIRKVNLYLNEGKTVVIGAFENSRTQNIAETLRQAGIKVYIDGGGREIYQIYYENAKWCPDYPEVILDGIEMVASVQHRQKLLEDGEPKVIITTAGMFDGGPMEGYLEYGLSNPKFVFIATSYVSPRSKAALLLEAVKEENPEIELEDGRIIKIKAKVERIGFTAHGNVRDFEQLVKTIYETNGGRRIKSYLVHGMLKTKQMVAELVKECTDCVFVEHGQVYDLTI
ncbi:MAG: hypothetical protein HYW77_03495 [Parcubacteria group bacterium]|nr:hypothetical protein [Parcubacteria group bacterium]